MNIDDSRNPDLWREVEAVQTHPAVMVRVGQHEALIDTKIVSLIRTDLARRHRDVPVLRRPSFD